MKKTTIAATALMSQLCFAGNMYMGPTIAIQDNQASNSSYRGVTPRLTFGYSDVFEDLYIAGEVFASPGSMTLDDNYCCSQLSAKTSRSFGFSIIPGISINNNTMGYFRLGVITSNFVGPNTYSSGAQWGLGLQGTLTPYWDLRGEYIYTTYRTVSSLGAVKSDQAGLALIYKII